MHTFDSSRVVIELPPSEIEELFNDYCNHRGRLDRAGALPVVLAYADHTRVCGLIASVLGRIARAWHPMFAQVTRCEVDDLDSYACDPLPELVRRLDTVNATLDVVHP